MKVNLSNIALLLTHSLTHSQSLTHTFIATVAKFDLTFNETLRRDQVLFTALLKLLDDVTEHATPSDSSNVVPSSGGASADRVTLGPLSIFEDLEV